MSELGHVRIVAYCAITASGLSAPQRKPKQILISILKPPSDKTLADPRPASFNSASLAVDVDSFKPILSLLALYQVRSVTTGDVEDDFTAANAHGSVKLLSAFSAEPGEPDALESPS
jgi:hypothetical protein